MSNPLKIQEIIPQSQTTNFHMYFHALDKSVNYIV